MSEDYLKEHFAELYEQFGEQYQIVILKEELNELGQAIAKYERNLLKQERFNETEYLPQDVLQKIIEESADVLNTLDGLLLHLNIKKQVTEKRIEKIKRTDERVIDFLKDKV